MNDKVQAALDARKKKKEDEYSNDKVKAALKNREKRISSNKDSIIADIQNRYGTVMKDYSSSAESYKPSYGEKSFADTMNKHRTQTVDTSNLKKDIEAYRKLIGNDEAVDEMISNLDTISGGYRGIFESAKYYSQFEDETDQTKFEANWLGPDTEDKKDTAEQRAARKSIYEGNKARIAEIEAEMDVTSGDKKKYSSLESEKEKLETENKQYERTQGKVDSYAYLYDQEDFEETSANRDFTNPTRDELEYEEIRMDSSTWYTDANGTTYNALGEVVAENDIYGIEWDSKHTGTYYLKNKAKVDRLGLFLSTDEDEWGDAAGNNGTWEDIINAGIHGNWEQLREEEISAYYYLLNTKGYEAADKFLDDMTPELNRRATEEYNEHLTELFEDANPLMKAALSIASVGVRPLGNISAGIEDAFNIITGNDINPYSSAHAAGNFSSQVRGLQAEELDKLTGGASIPLLDFSLGDAYQAGMSYLDMLTSAVTGSAGYAAQMGAGAFSGTATDLWKEGASMGEIGSLATISGVAEGLFEKFSIDKLIEIGDAKTLGQVLKNIGIQGGIEATEEMATEATNIIADAIIRDGTSNWNKLLEESNGDVLTALGKELQQVGKAGLSGFIAGALGGGASSVASNIEYNAAVEQHGQNIIDNKGYEDLKALALEVSEGAAGTKIGNKLAKNVKKADTKTTAKNVGRLSEQVETVKGRQNTAEIQSALMEKGMSKSQARKTAQTIAEVAEKNAAGVEITQAEYDAITKSEVVNEVYRSLIFDTDSSINIRNLKHSNTRQGIKVNEDGTVTTSEGHRSRTNSVVEKVLYAQSRFEANTGVVEEVDEDVADTPMTAEDAMAYKGKTTYTNPETGETKIVDIKGISKIENGEMTLKLDNGETVNASDVRFASEGEALVYSTVVDMGVNAGVAEALVNNFKATGNANAGVYASGISDAYFYGEKGIPLSELGENSFTHELSEADKQFAYKLGQSEAEAQTKAKQQAQDTKVAQAKKKGEVKAKSGKVIVEDVSIAVNKKTGEIDESKLNDMQRANIVGIKALAKLSPINFHIFQSKKVDGKFVATINEVMYENSPNGVYSAGTNDIWIDLNAGDNGTGTMLVTAAHEISHYIRERSPAKWKAMADIIMTDLSKRKDLSVGDLLDSQKAKITRRADADTKTESEIMDEAYEELVSDALSEMLIDGSVVEFLADVKQKDRGLWDTIKDAIADLLRRWSEILRVYKKVSSDTREAQAFHSMKKTFDKLQKMYAEAFAEANAVEEAVGSTAEVDTKLSDRNSTYMDAVKRDDMKTAQKMVDEAAKAAGYIIRGNHGTVSYFNIFDRSYGNAEGDWGKGFYFTNNRDDVEENYANTEGADLTAKIEQLAEQLEWQDEYADMDYDERLEVARKELIRGEPRVIEAYLKMQNPVVIGGKNETFFDVNEEYDEENDEFGEPTGKLVDFVEALSYVLEDYEWANVDANELLTDGYDGYTAAQLEKAAKKLVWDVEDYDSGRLAGNEIVRAAFEKMGFDGIVDNTVAAKFGSRSGRRNAMVGVDIDTTHYIVFKSEQIKQSDPVTYDSNGKVIPLSERFNAENKDIRYSLRGTNKNGIEVYETSEEIKKPSIKERQKAFLDIMRNQYRGRTAKFIRNGHTYYASFDYRDINKNIYGDKLSDKKGWKAKLNVGAEGEIFELVENARYNRSKPESGKTTAAHSGVEYWDYFIKTVQIDNTVFDLLANVRKKADGQFVYSIQLNENKKIEASPSLGSPNGVLNRMLNASDNSISHLPDSVKRLFSERNTDSNRSLLANALETTAQDEIEAQKLAEYKEKISLIDSEQQKLAEINAEIRELSFAKGKRDEKKLKSLRFDAVQIANRINTYDRQLLNLESTKVLKAVLNREKRLAMKRQKQKNAEALKEYREKFEVEKQKIKQKNAESRKNAAERRHKSAIKEKIKNFKAKLESSLLSPTDRVYVPINLTKAMIDICDLIDTDTDLYKADGSINKAQERRNATKDRLQALKDEYEALKDNTDPTYSGEFDEVIYKYLTKLRNEFGDKSLADMTLEELTDMYEVLRSINETLQDARKLIGRADAKTIYEAADSIIAEQAEITKKRKKGKRNAAQKSKDNVINMSLSPVRNVERMSGYNSDSELVRLFHEFEKGVRRKNFFVMKAYKAFEALTTGNNAKMYDDAIYKEFGTKRYTDVNGRKFGISKMQMMQAILSHEREVANKKLHHIENDGFTFADMDMLRKGKLREAISEEYSHRLPAAINLVEDFKMALANDKWAQEYMEAARKFFNGTAKDTINETYLTLKHRILARDKSYIPFEVDKNFVVREISAQNDIQQTINSYGMLQETKEGASQPLIITGLNNILDRHIDQVGNVYGLAIPVRNFNKVWNVRSVDDNSGGASVQAAIQRNWGVGGTSHITQTVQDLQGARPNTQSDIYRKVKSGYIGATFALNLSVVTKQIGSLYSATSMLKWRGGFRMFSNLLSTMANHKKISAEVDKYTASAWMRRQGLSDAELHTLITESRKPGLLKFFGKFPTIINPTKWITAMDSTVALSLWKYAKQDTAKKTGLKGEELLKATAEFYDSVIENTQSMTDVLHRPEIQKRSDVVSEAFGMFKTDLYQMAGQLQLSLGRYSANKNAENGKALGRTAYAVLRSAIWGQLMTTLFALLRYKVDPYRDEEDKELTIWSWLKRQGIAFIGDIFGYLTPLFGSEVVDVFENIMYGESDDIVDSLALTAINDLYDAMITVGSAVKEGEMPTMAQFKKLVTKALQAFGVPANNVSRIVDAITLHAKDIANGKPFSFEAGAERSPANYMHGIVEDFVAGNEDKAAESFDKAVEDKGDSALKTALGNMYKDGGVDSATVKNILSEYFGMEDDDIHWLLDKWDYATENGSTDEYDKYDEFISAVESGQNLSSVIKKYTSNGIELDTLKATLGKRYREGGLSEASVMNILTSHFEMEEDDAYWLLDKWDYTAEEGTTEGYSKYDDFYSSVETGKDLKSTIKIYLDNGVSKDTLARQITTHFKPIYKEMTNSERAKLKGYLLNAYEFLGKKRGDKSKDINDWLKSD